MTADTIADQNSSKIASSKKELLQQEVSICLEILLPVASECWGGWPKDRPSLVQQLGLTIITFQLMVSEYQRRMQMLW